MNSLKHACRFTAVVIFMILNCWKDLDNVRAQPIVVDSIQEQLTTETSDSAQLELHLELTMQFEYLEPDVVKQHAAAAAALADKLNEPTKAIRAQYQLAVAQYLSGDFALAEATLREVESKSSFSNEEKSQLDIYNLMGTILTTRDKVSEGLAYQFKALELAKLIPDTSRIITALSNIATTYKSNLDTARCRKYYMEALQLAMVVGDTISLAVNNNNLSEIMIDPDSILHFADAALSAFRDLEYKDGIAHSSNQFGVGLLARKDFRRAIPYFHVALNIWTPSSYRPGISSAATNLATSYGYLRKADSLAHYASLAEKIGIELEDKTILKESFGKFARMYEETGKTALALQYLKRAVELQDLLYSNERAKQFANAETSFNTREKERELIEKELTIAQQKSTKKNYLILLAIILLLAIASIQYLLMRQKIRKKIDALELEKERHASEKLRELDQLKGKFFADISHEFRTPLTLIQTPLRQAIQKTRPGDLVLLPQHLAHQMHKSSEDLLSLVNQLLDLAKLEDGRMNLEVANSDIAQFIKATVYSFESLAISKEITLLVNIGEFDFDTWFDRKKLFHILTNLLSNAIKFTETGGQIAIDAMILKDEILEIAVHDTGRGISEEILPHIFDRFTSLGAEGESVRSTGIGLALTSELVKLHQGTISVTSTSDSGTTFTVRLPIKKSAFPNATIVNSSSNYAPATRNREEVLPDDKKSQVFHVEAPVVLLVEDNIELLHFTKEILSSEFKVDTAQNGREGLEKARATIPDLIITDVMMPELDGILFSKEIRESPQTSHIPIIMLTAKADRRDKIRGLKLGVDDYLTKPFDSTELLVRAQNLIHQRKQLLKRFSTKSFFQPSEIASTPVDEIFLNQVMCTIKKELANPNFGVEDLSKSVSFSRSQLHRKLKALTDKSPNELIRNFRLERARELLRDKSGTASEIAYQVGFSSLPYFSKCYKDQFGISPSEV